MTAPVLNDLFRMLEDSAASSGWTEATPRHQDRKGYVLIQNIVSLHSKFGPKVEINELFHF